MPYECGYPPTITNNHSRPNDCHESWTYYHQQPLQPDNPNDYYEPIITYYHVQALETEWLSYTYNPLL